MTYLCRCRWSLIWVWTSTFCMLPYRDTSAIIISDVGRQYEGVVTQELSVTYSFSWPGKGDSSLRPLRLTLSSNASNLSFLSASVKTAGEAGVASWNLPVLFKRTPHVFNSTSRTVCLSRHDAIHNQTKVLVNFLTASELPVAYSIVARTVDDFVLKAGRENLKRSVLSPTSSVYYRYDFEPGQQLVTVLVESTDTECGMVSVQKAECPILDQANTFHYAGSYQSFSGLSAIVVRRDVIGDSFHVVVIGLINKELCRNSSVLLVRVDQSEVSGYDYKKNITIQVLPLEHDYSLPVSACLAGFLITYVLAFLHLCLRYHMGQKRVMSLFSYVFVTDRYASASQMILRSTTCASIANPAACLPPSLDQPTAPTELEGSYAVSTKEVTRVAKFEEVYTLEDVNDCVAPPVCSDAENNISKAPKHEVGHTTSSPGSYASVLSAVAVFFGLPAFQLLYNYQKILNIAGTQDLCQFNFMCLLPLGKLSAFNNIFSNVGYCLLGLLLILQTYRYQRIRRYKATGDTNKGLREDYGIYYAIGCTLFCEGFWSASYHGCPNLHSILLDVSFIYLMVIFVTLALYRKRHPDAATKPHQIFLFVGILVFIGLLEKLHKSLAVWTVVGLLYTTLTTVTSGYLYHHSWLGSVIALKSLCSMCRSGKWCSQTLASRHRFTLSVVFQTWNLLIVAHGMYSWRTLDVTAMFSNAFASNAVGYLIYYLVMKVICKEGLRPLSIFLLFVTVAVGAVAFISHFTAETRYELTPSESRLYNRECYMLGFFSLHDIWHLGSAYLVFTLALLVLTVDDNLKTTPTYDIQVW